jgi:hypothetical protein
MFTVAPIIINYITFAFTFHMLCISVVRSLYFRISEIPLSLLRIMMSGLLSGMVLSVCTCLFRSVITLPSLLFLTKFGTYS